MSFEVGDLSRPEELAYADEFDGICAFGFLHHLPLGGIAGIFDLAHRALRPGGAFYSVDPNARRLVRHFSRLVQRKYDHYHSPDEHELEPQVLVGLALDAGLASPQVRASDYFANPLGWILPGLPKAVASPLVWLDHGLSALPVINRYSSSFSRSPGSLSRASSAPVGQARAQALLRAATRFLEPLLVAAFVFAGPPLTSSTLRLSASMRSMTGVSCTGSGLAISCPVSFASSI